MAVSSPLLAALTGVLFLLVLFQFVMIAGLNRRMALQSKMLRQFFSGPNDENLELLLSRVLEDSRVAKETAQGMEARVGEMLTRFEGCVQHFALVRYDAFEDVTGQMSFSLALLDGQSNGAIISAIYGRSNSRCFGKMILQGQAEAPLSDEEQQALIQALETKSASTKTKVSRTKSTPLVSSDAVHQNSVSANGHFLEATR